MYNYNDEPSYIAHSSGPWKNHKYIKKVGDRYYYAPSYDARTRAAEERGKLRPLAYQRSKEEKASNTVGAKLDRFFNNKNNRSYMNAYNNAMNGNYDRLMLEGEKLTDTQKEMVKQAGRARHYEDYANALDKKHRVANMAVSGLNAASRARRNVTNWARNTGRNVTNWARNTGAKVVSAATRTRDLISGAGREAVHRGKSFVDSVLRGVGIRKPNRLPYQEIGAQKRGITVPYQDAKSRRR